MPDQAQESPASSAVTAFKPLPLVGFDTETYRFAAQNLAPRIICLQTHCQGEGVLVGAADGEALNAVIETLFLDREADSYIKIGHNVKYDLAVVCAFRPDTIPAVFRALEAGRVRDTIVREKLLNLASHGDLEFCELPDGGKYKIEYNLAAMVREYFGQDISSEKDEDDAWRINYEALADQPSESWPEQARKYALDDARYPLEIHELQERKRQAIIEQKGIDPLETQDFHVAVDFALYLMSCHGFAVDPVKKAEIEAMLREELSVEKTRLLIEQGILRPGEPPRPHAKGAKQHAPDCPGGECPCPPKMTGGKKESIDTKKLHAYVKALADKLPEIQLRYTKSSSKFPEGQLSVDAEFLDDYAHLDPVLEQLEHRQKLQKLVTTELPRMNDPESGQTAAVVHPSYDVLKSTGRTSSFASKAYPSFNTQNVHPSVRNCFVPRRGRVLFGIDFSQMELGTLAQTCLNLLGFSVLAEKINAGIDPHTYLGSQLAYHLAPEFREVCDGAGVSGPEGVYEAFLSLKSEDDTCKDFFKHYRKFAKPTGLGYPGGLGPRTFIKYAKKTFGVVVNEAEATALREVWHQTYPEMRSYFEYVNKRSVDSFNGRKKVTSESGEERWVERYAYMSPMGMYRAGCDYCACANGLGLQTPSAEGAKLAVFNAVRACYDPTQESHLCGNAWPIAFIHDELVGEVVEDGHMSDRVGEIGEIMVKSMRVITPDVQPRVEAVLMSRWDKAAEAVYDDSGKLTVWSP